MVNSLLQSSGTALLLLCFIFFLGSGPGNTNLTARCETHLDDCPRLRQVQKVIIKAWRKEWKRALAEYEAEREAVGAAQ